jgi:type III pantothenate kinase
VNLLALDIGNSCTNAGLFREGRLLLARRAPTGWLADHPQRWCYKLLREAGIRAGALEGAAIASVVPAATIAWSLFLRHRLGCAPFIVTGKTSTSLKIKYRPVASLGADRFVNALAASHFHKPPLVCASLGTATVVDAISADYEFLGGAILPGVSLFSESLEKRTALLPKVSAFAEDSPIGSSTAAALRAGAIFGTAAAVEGLFERFRLQLGKNTKLALTGGNAPLILPHLRVRCFHHPTLGLEGVRLAWEECREGMK